MEYTAQSSMIKMNISKMQKIHVHNQLPYNIITYSTSLAFDITYMDIVQSWSHHINYYFHCSKHCSKLMSLYCLDVAEHIKDNIAFKITTFSSKYPKHDILAIKEAHNNNFFNMGSFISCSNYTSYGKFILDAHKMQAFSMNLPQLNVKPSQRLITICHKQSVSFVH